MSDFTGWGFAVGAVRGIRGWRIESDSLKAASGRGTWTAGENVAHCMKQFVCDCPPCRAERDAVRAAVPHAMEKCECGFYAYYGPDGSYVATYVSGVIEGYGRVVVGSKGFRAEKAKVVALCAPDEGPSWTVRRSETAAAIAYRFGVPFFTEKAVMLAEFPTSTETEFAPATNRGVA